MTVASEIEGVALSLFQERGFGNVTVEDITMATGVSPRTFYRYFPAKEDVFQLQIERRSRDIKEALGARPEGEPPFESLGSAITQVFATEDAELVRLWTDVVARTPNSLRSVIGGIQLKSQTLFAEFFADRLGFAADALVPTMLAATVTGVIQASQIHWYVHGGDLVSTVSEGLRVLQLGFGRDLQSLGDDRGRLSWPDPDR